MNISVRVYQSSDLPYMIHIWNEVVEDGHYEDICPYYHTL